MARRTSPFEELMALSAKMPWPLGVAFAVLSFLAFHAVAAHFTVPAASPTTVAGLGLFAQRQLIATIAMLLQYIAPIAFLVGAGVSFWRRSHGIHLHRRALIGGAHAIDAMSWAEFEMLVGQSFRELGYSVSDNPVRGPDGGIDLVLSKGDEQFLVQCKQWRSKTVGASVVRELFGVLTARGSAGGFVVTSGQFTAEAKTFAAKCRIELIDGDRLSRMIGAAVKNAQHDPPITRSPSADSVAPTISTAVPNCPRCGGAMARRIARKGSTAGTEFWGCKAFPKCRGTV